MSEIHNQFSDVFQPKVGEIPNYQCFLSLRVNAQPIFIKPRRVPYALQEKGEQNLGDLENQGIIKKTDHSEWGTPLNIVPKKNGDIRLCADYYYYYKVTINNQLQDNRYPILRIEDSFNIMKNGKYFCTLDVFKARLHVPVDDESARTQTISTHRGTYLVKRLFFGIKTTPNEFHKVIYKIVHDLEGTTVYFDDIMVQGSSIEECKFRLIKVLERLRKDNLHMSREKCQFFKKRIQYLGHVISKKGLEKSEDKIKAIIEAPRPTSLEELQRFLGMVIIQKAKAEIAIERVFMSFTPDLDITLATDASPYGLAGVLSHRFPDGCEKPVAFASRSLTKAERHPATNGQAERYCQTLKTKFKCMMNEPGDLHAKLCKFLLQYRVTPLSSGQTPSELFFQVPAYMIVIMIEEV
ncbi:uncharacterized protein K02A2.6-like [Zophobas morio]|uniref:uncharacterized protein K02A2.6-like n=1 Tax=Zophobas morio TaxID=2755281 RepID=UPI00308389B0